MAGTSTRQAHVAARPMLHTSFSRSRLSTSASSRRRCATRARLVRCPRRCPCLTDAVHAVAAQVSANPIEEDHLVMEAIQLAQQRKFDTARDLAESVLHSNPNNTTAIQVNASECESRQDWGMAVRSARHLLPPAVCWRERARATHAEVLTSPSPERYGRQSASCRA